MATSFLVTGGCGFIGSRLVAKLVHAGHSVAVVDDLSLGAERNLGGVAAEAELLVVDIRNEGAVAQAVAQVRPDKVIHLAALHFIPACDRAPKVCVDVNVGGTQALLDACAATQVGSVVLASSAAVYAPATTAHDEQAQLGPTDVYGLTKLWTEQLGARFSRLVGVPTRVARLFNVFGPGETNPHLVPSVIAQARQGVQLRLGNLDTARDYVFVDDVAEALIAMSMTESSTEHVAMNIGRGTEVTGHDIVAIVASLMGTALQVVSDPERMRASDRPHLCSDPRLAKAELGWRAGTDLRDGLDAAMASPMAAGAGVAASFPPP